MGKREALPAGHAIALFGCALYFIALSFMAWGWPSIDGYPAIERFLDPGYLVNDAYTNTTAAYGPDTVLAYTFGPLQQATGIGYELAHAILNLARFLAWPWLLYRFFKVLTGSAGVAIVGVTFGALSSFSLPRTPGWEWLHGDPTTAMFAVFVVTWAWTLFLERTPARSFLLFAVAVMIHPLITVHGLAFLALIFLFDYSQKERMAAILSIRNLTAGVVFAAAFLFQYTSMGGDSANRLGAEEYARIIAFERHPGDYIPSRMSMDSWASFLIALLPVTLVLRRCWHEIPKARLMVAGLVTYLSLCVAGYFFIVPYPIRFFIQLMPYRSSFMAVPLMLAVLAVFMDREIRKGHYLFTAIAGACFLLASPYGTKVGIPTYVPTLILAAIVVLRLVFDLKSAPAVDAGLNWIFGPKRIWGAMAVMLLLAGAPAAYLRRSSFILPAEANQNPLFSWANHNTDPNAVFLMDQFASDKRFEDAVSPQKMRLIGRRAVVASRDFPFLDKDIKPWHDRWTVVLNGGELDRVDTATATTLLAIHKQYPFDYLVRRRPLEDTSDFEEVAAFASTNKGEKLLVYRFRTRGDS